MAQNVTNRGIVPDYNNLLKPSFYLILLITTRLMKLIKFAPFLLALVIFIISNFIQRGLDNKKRSKENRIAQIEKDLTAYLQYQSLATADFNFGTLHFNAIVETITYNRNDEARRFYMNFFSR